MNFNKYMNIGLIEFAQQQEQQKRRTPGLVGAAAAGAAGAYGGGIAASTPLIMKKARKMDAKGITPTAQNLQAKVRNPDGSLSKFGRRVNRRVNVGMAAGAAVGIGAQQYLHRRKQRNLPK